MIRYHDDEWGVPVHDDLIHFEFLILESAQAGLSWRIIFNKRANYKKAFAQFNAAKVAKFGAAEIRLLLNNPGIVRNKLKINAAISNARCFLAVQKEFGSFLLTIHSQMDTLAVAILERDEERGRRRSLSTTPRTSDEVAAHKRPAPKGKPEFGRLRRCSSSTCHRGHAFVVAPCIRSKLELPVYPLFSEWSVMPGGKRLTA